MSAVPVGVDWVVHLYNGGPGLCLVQSIAYMLKTFAGDSSPPVALFELIQMLEGIGLFIDDDYTLNPIGVGAPIPATTTLELVSFNRRALNLIESFDVVIRVTDIVGDEHERMLRCLQGAPCRN